MKTLPLATALTLAAWLMSSIAQTATAPALPAASASAAGKPRPRPLNPKELRESATPPGDLRPEDPVRPQISIPLGKKPAPALAPEPRAQRRIGSAAASAAAGRINDASARCEAEADAQARVACRGKLAQAAGKH
ncbi:MAG: hypothetical protein ABI671_08170 [Burkholderiales bacterium]